MLNAENKGGPNPPVVWWQAGPPYALAAGIPLASCLWVLCEVGA